MLAGDNGLAIGRHGLMGKQNLYDHSLHVPLVMAGPGIPRGEKREAPAYLLDIFPTLCELIEAPTPSTVEGHSLAPLLRDATARSRDTLVFAYRGFQRAVLDGRYKLIEYVVDGVRTTQLFDLQEDPWELRNLAGQPHTQDKVAELRAVLQQARIELDDHQPGQGAAFWSGFEA